MRRGVRLRQVNADGLLGREASDRLDESEMPQALAGYILKQPSISLPQGMVRAWGYLVVMTGTFGGPAVAMAEPMQPRFDRPHRKWLNRPHPTMLQLRPVGRLVPVAAPQPKPDGSPTARSLRPVRSGQAYRITSPPARGLITPELAKALETVFERFAHERAFTPEEPLKMCLARGFKADSPGHGEGRAADIAAVGGKSLLQWKQEWDHAMAVDEKLSDRQQQDAAVAAEQKRNLGYQLYKALQEYGGWRVDQQGWQPYRGVMQLFGPWTATEGPWKALQIKDPNPYQRQRLADQQWVFRAHRDHIHVAK
jgi:hypothetical protein